jgi:hypothetical protein
MSGDAPNILEYDLGGNLVKTIKLPSADNIDIIRDMTVDPDGNLQVYTKEFPSLLETLDAKTNLWTSHTFPGWSTVNNTHFGGVAALGQYIYVTDMQTGGSGDAPNGIVRFDRSNNYAGQRFENGTEYIEDVAGFDGLLYGLRGYGPTNQVDVIDPVTMNVLRRVTLQVDYGVENIAVNAQGDFFVGSNGTPTLYHLSPTGSVIATLKTAGVNDFIDIALSNDHKILASIADPAGGVFMIQTDETLASSTATHIPGNTFGNVFITYADPQILPGRDATVHFVPFTPASTQSFSGTVATFTSIDPNAAPGNFTATIDWGDLTQSGASGITLNAHTFSVIGSHTYSQPGPYHVVVSVVPDSGSSGSDAGNITVSDGLAPTVSITQKPGPLTNSSTATFGFSGSDNVTPPEQLLFKANLDGAGFASVTNPVSFTNLFSGGHTIQVESVDAAGNASVPVSYSWTVDLSAPNVELTQEPPALTNSSSASFAFTGSDNLTPTNQLSFQTSLDGATFGLATSPLTYNNLLSGMHTFRVEAVDQAGNVGPALSWNWTIDTTAPTLELTQVPPSLTSLASVTFAFDGADDVTPASQLAFRVSLDGASFTPGTSPQTYTNLTAGNHTFAVEAIDEAGNPSAPLSYAWTVDRVAPTIALLSQPSPITSDTTASFTFAGSDDLSAADKLTYQISLDGSAFAAGSSPASFSGLGAGSHTFRVQALDEAGNTSLPASSTWTIDVQAPTATISQGPAQTTRSTSAEFDFAGTDDQTLANQLGFLAALDGATFAPSASPLRFNDLAAGSHKLQVEAVDKAGNVSAPTEYDWVIDLEPPVASVTQNPPLLANSKSATFAVTGSDNVTAVGALAFKARLDGGSFTSVTSVVVYSGLTSGSHSFELIASDQAGNASASFVYTWTVDTAAPTVTLEQVPLGSSTNASPTLSFLGSDDHSPTSQITFEVGLDGSAFTPSTSPVEFHELGVGSHTVLVRASDQAGNTSVPLSYSWQVLAPAASQLQFSTNAYSTSRLAGKLVIPVVRTGSNAETVTVHYATADGTAHAGQDYQSVSGVLIFAPGSPTQTITIPIVNSGAADSATLTVALSAPTQGASLASAAPAVVTIDAPLTTEPLPANLAAAANALTHSAEGFGVFILQAYQLYLHRPAEQQGIDFWTARMQAGMPDEALEANFLGSVEYIHNHGGTGSAWVKGMYEDLLGREPDAGGLDFWTQHLQGGADPIAIALGFAASAEREALRIGADYEIYLGRSLDSVGQQYWVSRFLAGARNEDVVGGFVGSAEYWSNLTKGQQNRQAWIRAAFQDILHRAATSNDLAFWTQFLG